MPLASYTFVGKRDHMQIKDVEGEHEEPVNLLSLIDTLFFLVMFFLVATQFKED